MKTFCYSKSRGFTLTEMAIVLSIISVVLGSIWTVAKKVGQQQQNQAAVNELQTIAQNVLAWRSGQAFTKAAGSSITTDLINAGAIPNNYVNAGAGVTPWGQQLTVQVGTTKRNFRIIFSSVPTLSSCINMILQATNCQTNQAGCPTSIYTDVNGAWVALGPDPTTGWRPNSGNGYAGITLSNVETTLCQQAGNAFTTNNFVDFEYSL